MIKLTAIIPTKNEIHNIEAVLATVGFADEILVIDSYSTDGTFEKAQSLATTVLQRKFDAYSAQKNYAISQAKHEWILLVDADERVTPELQQEILSVLSLNNIPHEAYNIKRINHFMGQRVQYSGWRNDSVIRLFKRDFCKYNNKQVHESLLVNGSTGVLKQKFLHYSYRSFNLYMEKMNHYATLQAKDYDKKTGKLTPYHFVVKPFWGFFKHYIVQSGFRDGLVGFTIGNVQAYVVFMRYVKLWLLRKGRD
ncbi:glycosyltransferase family 2 protein [Bizionia gelidisalsuginis]|uniref:Glycosyltransferase family 2 protein n=2 Tax=Bizionia TaxID=283785 RepID=A0A8H2LHI8_9FLAO|nr:MULTISPECIES: glycosyltransferase family 2 protein [Bizionia]TYB80248.1 glycosyltransferase family 2 protein [Bizionia saleffrena]TYC17091.1 glycosyltransferase family 2 protein [Bizionia gelidisalsuginis]